jgi:hypothetical protein
VAQLRAVATFRRVSATAIVILVVAALGVFAIAAVVIGREARRLDAVAPRAVYDLDEAVQFVADRLPGFAASSLTYDDVRELLRWHMFQMREKGLQPEIAVDQVQHLTDEPVVVGEDSSVGYLIGRAEESDLEVRDEDIVAVVDAHLAYFEVIGAVGPQADDPDVPA